MNPIWRKKLTFSKKNKRLNCKIDFKKNPTIEKENQGKRKKKKKN